MEWQPIATAPKDGRWFMICREGDPCSREIGQFDPMIWADYEDAENGLYRKVMTPISDWRGFNNMHRATHWCDVPDVPPPHATEETSNG
jgi:hypothetical protein